MAFIIDTYNQYNKWDRTHSIYIFSVNGIEYAIKEVKLEWGLPQLQQRIDQGNQYLEQYQVYGSKEEALEFVHQVKNF